MKVRTAVLAALLLARMPPHRIRSVMRLAAGGSRQAEYETADAHYRAVAAAGPRCAGWRGCLPRSIAVALLCRAEGRWPDWNVGVRRTPPFAAHAWLEAEGRVVAEPGTPTAYGVLIHVGAADVS
ncbi:lasso peptide biosynthesis B2 protein [Streptomyces sp. NPDC097619]|uniref:lasso peptide biosynthesis B2 protein n=1 Tax=Streptomyces sp. NPDC097619 TaxID=3157228 RepID=UPI00332F56BB